MLFGLIALGLTFLVPVAYMLVSDRAFERSMNEGSTRHMNERIEQQELGAEIAAEIAAAVEVDAEIEAEQKLAA